ncbi:MAG TPA: GtrA family protein [Actinospica sp.]|jgi:putative flippase GtrA|nr:GtrA family protein [Actinospica sp.]
MNLGTFLRYGAGSVVAMGCSELVLVGAYNLGSGPELAAVLAWAAGAVPNYVLNRRWAWKGEAGSPKRRARELTLYWLVTLSMAALAIVATTLMDDWIKGSVTGRGELSVLLAAAYLFAYGVVFVARFVLFDRLVFTDRRSRHQVPSTTRA